MTFISTKTGQFRYFALQLDDFDWQGKDVLDFGGNIGNLLRDPECTAEVARYTCIDVDREAIDRGRESFPEATWLHYDRYCFYFNPGGMPGLAVPDPGRTFDYIVCYSVFTNTLRRDMFDLVEQLKAMLKPSGKLAFTFIDQHFHAWPGNYAGDNLMWRLERDNKERPEIDNVRLHAQAANSSWCTLVNASEIFIETEELPRVDGDQQQSCHTYYTAEYMQSLFPGAIIRPPANQEMQHCCILA
ncbi:MAG: class I SAM-dependent methyltransferase [Pseudomonadota bacterium]